LGGGIPSPCNEWKKRKKTQVKDSGSVRPPSECLASLREKINMQGEGLSVIRGAAARKAKRMPKNPDAQRTRKSTSEGRINIFRFELRSRSPVNRAQIETREGKTIQARSSNHTTRRNRIFAKNLREAGDAQGYAATSKSTRMKGRLRK